MIFLISALSDNFLSTDETFIYFIVQIGTIATAVPRRRTPHGFLRPSSPPQLHIHPPTTGLGIRLQPHRTTAIGPRLGTQPRPKLLLMGIHLGHTLRFLTQTRTVGISLGQRGATGHRRTHNLLLFRLTSMVPVPVVAEAVAAENAREIVIQIEIAVEISNASREMA